MTLALPFFSFLLQTTWLLSNRPRHKFCCKRYKYVCMYLVSVLVEQNGFMYFIFMFHFFQWSVEGTIFSHSYFNPKACWVKTALNNVQIVQSIQKITPEIAKIIFSYKSGKVHIFWEGHKILRNLPLNFDWHYIGQK